MESKKSKIVVLGCPKNRVDTEWGERKIKNGIYFINTCAFIKPAIEESIQEIKKAAQEIKRGEYKELWVVGCLVERYGSKLKKMFPEIKVMEGIHWYKNGEKYHLNRNPEYFGFLKISDGCDNRCMYCTIPYIKGKYKSREMEEILEETLLLKNMGIKEIVIIGNDITLYGMDLYGTPSLLPLLKKLISIKGVNYRLLYLYPSRVDEDLLKFIRDTPAIFNYVDVPFQHISSRVLKSMGRKYRKKDIISLVENLKKHKIKFRTTFITGYPTEEEEDFEEIMSFIEDYRPFNVGVFRYYHEDMAPAFRVYDDSIPEPIKEERKEKITELAHVIKEEELLKLKEVEVIVDRKEKGVYTGRTIYDAPEIDDVYTIIGKDLKIGNLYKGRVNDILHIVVN